MTPSACSSTTFSCLYTFLLLLPPSLHSTDSCCSDDIINIQERAASPPPPPPPPPLNADRYTTISRLVVGDDLTQRSRRASCFAFALAELGRRLPR
jgi:hypothetical protein